MGVNGCSNVCRQMIEKMVTTKSLSMGGHFLGGPGPPGNTRVTSISDKM